MTYKPDGIPKLVFGSIGVLVVGLFLSLASHDFLPYFYEKYQSERIGGCEDDHPVTDSAWSAIFGFDGGGRYIVGDSAKNRALIECIADSLSVQHVSKPLLGHQDAGYPALSITYSSFVDGYYLDYYPGSAASGEVDAGAISSAP